MIHPYAQQEQIAEFEFQHRSEKLPDILYKLLYDNSTIRFD